MKLIEELHKMSEDGKKQQEEKVLKLIEEIAKKEIVPYAKEAANMGLTHCRKQIYLEEPPCFSHSEIIVMIRKFYEDLGFRILFPTRDNYHNFTIDLDWKQKIEEEKINCI